MTVASGRQSDQVEEDTSKTVVHIWRLATFWQW